jgi:hypothetical protein
MPKHVKLLADLAVVPEDWVNGSRFTVEPKNSEKCQAQNHFKILRSFLDPARRCRAGGPLKNSCSMLQPSKSQQFPTSLNWKWKRQRCARCHRSLGIYAAVCRADRMHSESLQYGAQKKNMRNIWKGPMGQWAHMGTQNIEIWQNCLKLFYILQLALTWRMDDAGGEFASEVWQKNMRSTVHPLPRGAQDRKLQRCGPAIRLGRWILRSLSQPPNSHLDSAASMQHFSTFQRGGLPGRLGNCYSSIASQATLSPCLVGYGGLHPISSTIECMPRKEIHRNTSIQASTDVNRAGQHLVSSGWLPELGLSVTCQHR